MAGFNVSVIYSPYPSNPQGEQLKMECTFDLYQSNFYSLYWNRNDPDTGTKNIFTRGINSKNPSADYKDRVSEEIFTLATSGSSLPSRHVLIFKDVTYCDMQEYYCEVINGEATGGVARKSFKFSGE